MKTTTKTLIAALCLTILTGLSVQANSTPFTAIPPTSSSATSVKIVSFESIVSNNKVLLNWTIDGNQDANQFEVEKSINGKPFAMAALVFASEKTEKDAYMFYEKKSNEKVTYRIKIIQKDGTVSYSQVIPAGN